MNDFTCIGIASRSDELIDKGVKSWAEHHIAAAGSGHNILPLLYSNI